MESEIWKVYKESMYHGKKRVYEVSDQGRVKLNGKLVDFSKYTKKGYYIVGGFYVHRAVAELFIPNTDNKSFVDHINTNTHDNRAVNLRWVTYKENNNNPLTIKHLSEAQNVAQNRPEVKVKKSESLKKIQKVAQNRPEVKVKKSESSKGKNKNKCHMSNGIDHVFIKLEMTNYYQERGYHFGRK